MMDLIRFIVVIVCSSVGNVIAEGWLRRKRLTNETMRYAIITHDTHSVHGRHHTPRAPACEANFESGQFQPFEILNLGKYERQYWQGATFGERNNKPITEITEQALYEHLAFILKLYGARPLAGMVHLHGKKGGAMVHIGAVDAPVTIGEIDAAVDECLHLKQRELHVLGWEWEMGLYDLMVDAAKAKGVKLLLLQIPREVMEQQAADAGDVRFFELAYLECRIRKQKKRTARVTLTDFVIPNAELIPDDVRSKIRKWSDYIDYWAVDWARKLPLASDPHAYERPGRYRVLVKVIDVFGNDTSRAFDVEV